MAKKKPVTPRPYPLREHILTVLVRELEDLYDGRIKCMKRRPNEARPTLMMCYVAIQRAIPGILTTKGKQLFVELLHNKYVETMHERARRRELRAHRLKRKGDNGPL